jgi:hypothetical protein
MNSQAVANVFHAYAKLPTATEHLSALARERLEAAVERVAPDMIPLERHMTLPAIEKLRMNIPSALLKKR